MTTDELSALVATLITDFIRPNTQQHLESMERFAHIESLLDRHAEVIAGVDIKLDRVAAQQESNAQQIAQNSQQIAQNSQQIAQNFQQIARNSQQIAQNTEASTRFDTKLEETRQLVARNSSDLAQMGARQDQMLIRYDQMFERIDARLDRMDRAIDLLVEENRAFRESQQSQLAAIIGNGRRIDRLEQQAS